jgi:lipopolysaccharide transport system ATP-binding protein
LNTVSPSNSFTDSSEVLINVEGVSKKYCRNLHRSLKYGVLDLGRELLGWPQNQELRRGEFYAIRDLNFQISRGESVALMGGNGAGKSTTLKMLNGLIKPTSGRVQLRGKVAALTTLGAGFKPVLSGRENIYINAAILGFSKEFVDERIQAMIAFSEIGYAIDDPVKTYSSGMKARLGYSIGTFLEPDILLLDEVFAAGDRAFKLKCFNHLASLTDRGMAIIVVSHNVGRITSLCDRAIVFDQGTTCFDGASKEGLAEYYRVLGISPKQKKKRNAQKQQSDAACPAWIQNIKLLDEDDQEITRIDQDQPIKLQIWIAAQGYRDDLRVAVHLEAESGILATMRTKPDQLHVDEEGTVLELHVMNHGHLKGTFHFTVNLCTEKLGEVLHQIQAPFQISSRTRNGIVLIDHYWCHPETGVESSSET